MADVSSAASRAHTEAKIQAQKVSGGWVKTLARIGYVAKGVVYTIVGVLAVQAALGTGGATKGSRGALQTIAEQSFGQILLVLMAIGLIGYVVWRFAQSFLDAESEGTDAKALVKRAGYAVSGVSYALLAFLALRLAFGSGGGGGGGSSKQAWTAKLMSQPFGVWLVGIVGVIIIGVGLYHFYKVAGARFMRSYKAGEMSATERRWAKRLGQWGLSARGVTFGLIGIFFIQAALQHDPSEAKGLSAAFNTLLRQPYGPWLLGLVAVGFVAYGIYCFSKARYRHFETS